MPNVINVSVPTETQVIELRVPGPQGPQGIQGIQGIQGDTGSGVSSGGTAGQVLAKIDATDFNTQWVTPLQLGATSTTAAAGNHTHSYAPLSHTHPPTDLTRPAIEGSVVYAYGNSYVGGEYFGTGEGQRYLIRAAERLDFAIVNRGQGGYKMQDMVLDAIGTRWPHRNWTVGTKGVVTLECVTNDANFNGTATAGLKGFENALRSFCHFITLDTIVDSAAAGWTTANITVNTLVDGYGGSYAQFTAGTVASMQRTFTGTEVIVGLLGHANSGLAELDILVDGVVKATVPLSAQCITSNASGTDRPYVPISVRVGGLTNASHTLTIRSKNNVAQPGSGWLDYIGFRSATPPAIVINKGTAVADVTKDAAFAAYNSIIDTVAAEFPNVTVCDPGVGFNRATMIGPDGIHLSATGSAHYADALTPKLAALPRTPGSTDAGLPFTLPDVRDSLREITEISSGNYLVGHQKWGDYTYENLTLYLHKDGFVTVTGVWQYNAAEGATPKIINLTGPYVPRLGRAQILPGTVVGDFRSYHVNADGLYMRGALPAGAAYCSVHGHYPGAYAFWQ